MTPVSRRSERRQQTLSEIKTRAQAQMASGGAGALSLRAIASDMRMSSTAVYRYFDSQSDLIDALCVDAYASFGDALAAASERHRDEGPAAQWWAIASAARRWSLSDPQSYALIFGTPITGHHAGRSVTGPAAAHALTIPITVYAAAVECGVADIQRSFVPGSVKIGALGRYLESVSDLQSAFRPENGDLDAIFAVAHNAWVSVLGFLTSEQFGNLPNLITTVDELFHAHVRMVMAGMGFDSRTFPAVQP